MAIIIGGDGGVTGLGGKGGFYLDPNPMIEGVNYFPAWLGSPSAQDLGDRNYAILQLNIHIPEKERLECLKDQQRMVVIKYSTGTGTDKSTWVYEYLVAIGKDEHGNNHWVNPFSVVSGDINLSSHSIVELKDGEFYVDAINTLENNQTNLIADTAANMHDIRSIDSDLKRGDFKLIGETEEEQQYILNCTKVASHFTSDGSISIKPVGTADNCKIELKAIVPAAVHDYFAGFYNTLEDLQKQPTESFTVDKSFAFVYQAGDVHHNNDMPLMVRYTTKGNATGVTTASWKPAVPYAYNLLATEDAGTRVYKPIQAILNSDNLSLDDEGLLSIDSSITVKGKKTDGTAVSEKAKTIQFIDGLSVQKETDGSIKVKAKVTKQMESFLGFYDSESAIFAKAIEKKTRLIPEVTTAYLRHAPYGVTTEEAGSYEIYRWKGSVSRPSTPTEDDIKNKDNWHTGNKLATGGYPVVLLGTGTSHSSWTPTNDSAYQSAHYTGQMVYHTNDKSWYWSEGTKWEKLFPAETSGGLFLGSFADVDDLPSTPTEGSFAYVLNPVESDVIQRGNPTLYMYQASRWVAKYPRGSIIAKTSSGKYEHIEKIEVTGSIAQTVTDGLLHLDLSSLSQGDFKGFFNDKNDLPTSGVSPNESYAYVFTADGEGSVSAGKLIPQLYVYQSQGHGVTPTWTEQHTKGAIICNTDKSGAGVTDANRPITSIKFKGDTTKRIENPNRTLTIDLPFTMDSHFVGIFDNMNAFTEAAKTYAGKFVKYQITGVIKQVGTYKLVRWNQDDEAPSLEDIDNDLHWDHIPFGGGGDSTLKVHGVDGSGENYTKEITDVKFSSDFEMTDFTPTGDGRTGSEATYKGFNVFEDDKSISDTVKTIKFANCAVTKDSRNVVTVTPLDGSAPPAPDNTLLFTGKDASGGDVTEVSKPEIKFGSEFVLTEDDSVADKPKMDISLKSGSVLIPFTGKDASGAAVSKSFGTFEFSDAFELTDDESDPDAPSKVQIGLKAGPSGTIKFTEKDGTTANVSEIVQTPLTYVDIKDDGTHKMYITSTLIGAFDSFDDLVARAQLHRKNLSKGISHGFVRKAPVGTSEAARKGIHYMACWSWASDKTFDQITEADVANPNNWKRVSRTLNPDYAITVVGFGSEHPAWTPIAVDSTMPAKDFVGQVVYYNTTDAAQCGHYYSNGDIWQKFSSGSGGASITMGGKPVNSIKKTNYVFLNELSDGSNELTVHGTFLGIHDGQAALFDAAKVSRDILTADVTFGYVRKSSTGGKDSHYYRIWIWKGSSSGKVTDADIENTANWDNKFRVLNANNATTVTGVGTEYPSWTPEQATEGQPLLAKNYLGQIVYFNHTDVTKKGHYYSNGNTWSKLASSGSGNPIGIALDSVDKTEPLQKIDVLGDTNLFSYEDGELSLNLKNALVRADDLAKLNSEHPVNNNKSVIGYTSNNHKLYVASNKDSTTGAFSWQEFAYPKMNKDVDSCITRYPELVELSDQFDDTAPYQKSGMYGISETKALSLGVPIAQAGVIESKKTPNTSGGQELWFQSFTGLETGQVWNRFRVQSGSSHKWSAWKEVIQKLPLDETNFSVLVLENDHSLKDISGGTNLPFKLHTDSTCNIDAKKIGTTGAIRVKRAGKYKITVYTHWTGQSDWMNHTANFSVGLLFGGESSVQSKYQITGSVVSSGAGEDVGEYPTIKSTFKNVDLDGVKLFDIRLRVTGESSNVEESEMDPFKNVVIIEPMTEEEYTTGHSIGKTIMDTLGGFSFRKGSEVRCERSGSQNRVYGERYRTDIQDFTKDTSL